MNNVLRFYTQTPSIAYSTILISSRDLRMETPDMSDATPAPEPPYHLFLSAAEVPVATTAMRLLISDEAHQPRIRELAREIIDGLQGTPDDAGKLSVSLDPEQMKIIHTAVGLLFNDLQRGQADEREILRGILDKLPDKHTIRAIDIE